MKFSDLINAIKEFFFDIIGYLIPGYFLILLVSYFTDSKAWLDTHELSIFQNSESIIAFFLAYILGYVIYSLSTIYLDIISFIYPSQILKKLTNKDCKLIKTLSKIFYFETRDEILEETKKSRNFLLAKLMYEKKISKNIDINNMGVRQNALLMQNTNIHKVYFSFYNVGNVQFWKPIFYRFG